MHRSAGSAPKDIRTLFILGAGASRAANAPLMFDFMDRAHRLHLKKESNWAHDHFARVIDARKKLQVAYAKSNVDLDNIENLFSTFEMATLVGRLGDLPQESVNSLPTDLRFLIMRTIEASIQFEVNGLEGEISAPYPYDHFAELLVTLESLPEAGPVGVISFNYDLCLEYALLRQMRQPHYGVTVKGPAKSDIPLYKVHGSLNWFSNEQTGLIETVALRRPDVKIYFDRIGLKDKGLWPIDTMELLYGSEKWGASLHPKPIIVPPTWNKGVYQQMLQSVWRHAAHALATAENIFVIGYSLPPSDQFFKAFYSLSTISDSMIDRFWVYDPGAADVVSSRFRALLGPAIRDRDKFQHKPLKFSKSLEDIAATFGLRTTALQDL
jgi:hypothetical protein